MLELDKRPQVPVRGVANWISGLRPLGERWGGWSDKSRLAARTFARGKQPGETRGSGWERR